MKVFITGGTGKLGKELVKVFQESLHPTHEELDITDDAVVSNFIFTNKPDILIHCAAVTGIRQCEENKQLAWDVNVSGTENLVKALIKQKYNCLFVYISTACVFYGDKSYYVENDLPQPKNFYSLTKLLGEFVVKYSRLKEWLIIRTNFVARDRWPYPEAFTDRYGTYLFADDVAEGIQKVIEQRYKGTLHLYGEEKLSMFQLAKITTPEVKPITMNDYTGPPLTIDMSLKSLRINPIKLRRKI